MVNKPDRDTKAAWWLTSVYCDVCRKYIRKHHKTRHEQSAIHKRLDNRYIVMDSDRAFTAFLQNVRPANFVGAEARLYGVARYMFWETS